MDERTMIGLYTSPLFVTLPISFAGGVVLGLAYFRALRTTTDLIVGDGSPLLGLALGLGRFIVLGVGLYVAALTGGLALLAALIGIHCAKGLIVRKMRRVWA